jgi:molybdenum cofactor cytidylyltransferase
LASSLDDVVVVIGNSADEVRSALKGLEVDIVFNPDFADGQSTSFKAGITSLTPDTEAVSLMLGDVPGIDPASIDAVVSVWRASGASIVQARYRGVRSHPVLFARSMFSELLAVTGDTGASSVLKRHLNEIVPVDFDRDVPTDIDSEEDYLAALVRT